MGLITKAEPTAAADAGCGPVDGLEQNGAAESRRWQREKLDHRSPLTIKTISCYIVLRGGQPMTTMTIRLPERLRDDVQRLGKLEHKAVSDIVRESLRRHVAVQRFRAIRRKVLPFAEAQGLVTDEDVFKALS
ncbi:MAG: CopG family ribbon-helix-helix protein [Kiritimatiellia bacterium]